MFEENHSKNAIPAKILGNKNFASHTHKSSITMESPIFAAAAKKEENVLLAKN